MLYLIINCSLVVALPVKTQTLQISGQKLANYYTCSLVAKKVGDKAMRNYYFEMYTDASEEIKSYPKDQSAKIQQQYKFGLSKLGKFSQDSMATFCSSRFDSLSRKMQEKKLTEM